MEVSVGYQKVVCQLLRYVLAPLILSILFVQFYGTAHGRFSTSSYLIGTAIFFVPWYLCMLAINVIHGGMTDNLVLSKGRAFISWLCVAVILTAIGAKLAGGNDYSELVPVMLLISVAPIATYYLTEVLAKRTTADIHDQI